jgi:hypothetical protein
MIFPRRSFSFNSIVVVQLLDGDEEPTGRFLFEEPIAPICATKGIAARFVPLSSNRELVAFLEQLAAECETAGLRPVLHLEMHGAADGLAPMNDVSVPWTDVRESLQRINAATEVNLLITLGTCFGARLVYTVDPAGVAPFWGMVGPTYEILPSDVLLGYRAFYRALVEKSDLWGAIDQLRSVTYPDTPQLWGADFAEIILALAFASFLESNQPAATEAAELLSGFKQRFLMLDRYPENANRFPLSPEEAVLLSSIDREMREAAMRDATQDWHPSEGPNER